MQKPTPLFHKLLLTNDVVLWKCMTIKTHCHINSFALSLALKQRHGATRKWPIKGVVILP